MVAVVVVALVVAVVVVAAAVVVLRLAAVVVGAAVVRAEPAGGRATELAVVGAVRPGATVVAPADPAGAPPAADPPGTGTTSRPAVSFAVRTTSTISDADHRDHDHHGAQEHQSPVLRSRG